MTPLLYAAGQSLRIEHCRLIVDASGKSGRTALGGLQIGGGSGDVELRRNLIRAGNGIGITLGSIQYVTTANAGNDAIIGKIDGSSGGARITQAFYAFDANNCVQVPGDPQIPTGPGGVTQVPVSEGNLANMRIMDNRIEDMGQSGIAPALHAPWLAEYLHEMTVFPNGKHDDQVDSTAQFLDWLTPDNNALRKKPTGAFV